MQNKPEDFSQTFAGDINDSFKLGLAVTRKALKLYTDFYNSDIIIASPLGLRLVLGKLVYFCVKRSFFFFFPTCASLQRENQPDLATA